MKGEVWKDGGAKVQNVFQLTQGRGRRKGGSLNGAGSELARVCLARYENIRVERRTGRKNVLGRKGGKRKV